MAAIDELNEGLPEMPGEAARRWTGELCEYIERLVARRFGVSRTALTAAGRCDGTSALARHVAMYLQRILLELSHQQVAGRFLRHPTTVIYACRRIEDLRDDPAFDRRIAGLEAAIEARAAENCR